MSRAFILVGNAVRFYEDGKRFQRFLKSKVGISKISFVESCNRRMGYIETQLKKFFSGKKMEPRIIMYSGHGGQDGWWLDDAEKYSYDNLAELLHDVSFPCILVNQSCHSSAAKNFFEKHGVDPDRLSLIASCDER